MKKPIGYAEITRSRLLGLLMAILLLPVSAYAQSQLTVTGTVIDETGEPLIGATVKVVGETIGTATDPDGHYELQVPSSAKQLDFSYVGYNNLTADITPSHVVDVTMNPNSAALDEVVVIGYGVRKKDDLTGSVSTVSEKDFNQGMVSSAEELVNGKIAGVQIVNGGGSPTAGSTIRVRGGASLNASNDPLIVLDGVPMEVGGSVSGSGNFLSLINPSDIESMTVLKDASSTAIYGSRASNGVIIITTKKGKGDGVKVSFQTTNSVSTRTRTADMLSPDEFMSVVNRLGTDRRKSLLGDTRTDWNDQIFHTAFGTDNNLSVSGRATSRLPFRVSAGAYYQDGILKTDNARRFTGNINLTPSFFNDELKFQIGVKGTYSKNRFADTDAIWGGSVLNPTIPVYSGLDTYGGYTEAVDANGMPVTGAVCNPLGRLMQYRSTSDVYRVIGNIDAHWIDSEWGYRAYTQPDRAAGYKAADGATPLEGSLVAADSDGNIPAPEKGLYVMDFRMKELAYTLTPVTSVTYTGLNDNWSEYAMTQSADNPEVFTAEFVKRQDTPRGVKVLINHDWTLFFGGADGALMLGHSDATPGFDGDNLLTVGETYILRVDLGTQTYSYSLK